MRRHSFKIFGFLTAIGVGIEYVYRIWPARDGAKEFLQRTLLAGIAAAALTLSINFLLSALHSSPGRNSSGHKSSS